MNDRQKNNMEKLIQILNAASEAYYNSGIAIMSDIEFDNKIAELRKIEKETGNIMSNSPTVNVGSAVLKSLPEVKHEHKSMLSLDKVHSAKEIIEFSKGKKIISMIKLDGLSCRLTYEDGELIRAETRGDGEVGNLITEHAKCFKNIPVHINKEETYVIDGEAIITAEDFKQINDSLPKGVDKFKNSRNLAAGTLSLLDMSVVKQRSITFVAWDVIVGSEKNTLEGKIEEAKSLGFTVTPVRLLKDNTEESVEELNNTILGVATDLGYPCDGVVWKFNDVSYGESLGKTSHHFNNGCAFKPAAEYFPTKLLDVEWTMGKSGSLCPTIITEPVEIDGTMVNRASVHNCTIFKSFGFTKGCTCWLYKANMIIPQCYAVEDNETENADVVFKIPDRCPICGSPTKIIKDKDTEVLYCSSDECKGKLLGKLSAFVSKQAMNIDGLSEATLDLLIKNNVVSCFKDIYHLSDHKSFLSTLPKMGPRSVKNLLEAIEKSRNVTLENFITALSIPLIGKSTAKDISKYCNGSIDSFVFIIQNTALEFMSIDGFGQKMMDSLLDWWDANAEMVYELMDELEFLEPKSESDNNEKILDGWNFVITGKLKEFKNRAALVEKIESFGGKVVTSVSKTTTVLINNDKDSNSSKNKKARDLNTMIWSEIMFLEYLEMNGVK